MFYISAVVQDPNKILFEQIEKKYEIPKGLLYAIMCVESKGHPFAVYSKQKGIRRKSVYLNNAQEALDYVRVLQVLGVKNINVGCMQINLKCHTAENLSLWFCPEYNVDYAGRFLKELKIRKGSWKKAVAFYHSGSKEKFHTSYLNKVIRHFGKTLWNI